MPRAARQASRLALLCALLLAGAGAAAAPRCGAGGASRAQRAPPFQSPDSRLLAPPPRSAAPAWPARRGRALLASTCDPGYANASGACAACPVGSYAPGGSANATLVDAPGCILSPDSSGNVPMSCAFASPAPALAAAAAGEAAACVFTADNTATSNNCTLRYVYGASAFSTVADCVFGDALRALLNSSECAALGAGGSSLVAP